MKIRRATMEDFEKLKEIKILSKNEEIKYSNTLNPISENKESYYFYLKKELTFKSRVVFIALDNNKVIGIILAQYFKPLAISKYSKKGYISNLYILKSHRRKKIGVKLAEHALKWLKKNNVGHVNLEIHVDNKAALKLYNKLGFKNYTVKLAKEI